MLFGVRPLSSWLEKVEFEGKQVERFTFVEKIEEEDFEEEDFEEEDCDEDCDGENCK